MTTEDDFQRALDDCPEAHHTRLVFADWLQDHDDPRAGGFRAMGALRLHPGKTPMFPCWWSHDECTGVTPDNAHGQLPRDWFLSLPRGSGTGSGRWWRDFHGRREAENAAAEAFAELSPARRDELLPVPVTA